jgi:hypothetical protein
MITNIIELMRALDYVRGSPFLTAEQKADIVKELQLSLPAKALCHSAHRTHDIATGLFTAYASPAEEGSKEDRTPEQRMPARSEDAHVLSRTASKKNGWSKKVA